MFAYVGSRTTRERQARGKGITVYRLMGSTAELELVQLVSDLVNPSYLALTANARHLFCVHGDGTEVSAFSVDADSGRIALINRQDTGGRNPVHIGIDAEGRNLLITNHLGASLGVLSISDDGAVGPVRQLMQFEGPLGPHRIEQQQAKPHAGVIDPSGQFVVVPDKGLDRVFSFRLVDGHLAPAPSPFVTAREGAGPRSAVFHPTASHVYVANELDSTVTTYRFDFSTGGLAPQQVLSSLPADFTGNNRAASIAIDRSGHTLYVSNRGHDSIATFRLDPESRLPAFIDSHATQGRTPRFIALAPDGAQMFALNEDSDSIVALKIDAATGLLGAPRQVAHCFSPVCMVFA